MKKQIISALFCSIVALGAGFALAANEDFEPEIKLTPPEIPLEQPGPFEPQMPATQYDLSAEDYYWLIDAPLPEELGAADKPKAVIPKNDPQNSEPIKLEAPEKKPLSPFANKAELRSKIFTGVCFIASAVVLWKVWNCFAKK